MSPVTVTSVGVPGTSAPLGSTWMIHAVGLVDVVLPENAKASLEYEPVLASVSPCAWTKVKFSGAKAERTPVPSGAYRSVPNSAAA